MNIFILDYDIDTSVRMHCDKHVVKMIVETAQLLCSVYEPGVAPYRRTHYNHPCAVWVRSDAAHFAYTLDLGFRLCAEYTRRYRRVHKTLGVLNWILQNMPELEDSMCTEIDHVFCGFDECRTGDVVDSYRNLYRKKLADGVDMRYTNTDRPAWLV